MDLHGAEELFERLFSVVDHPLREDSPRLHLSAILAVTSMQFSTAVRILCKEGLLLGASATLRSQFEALVRSIWVQNGATDAQIEKLSAELNSESQQASKNIPQTNDMLIELRKYPQLKNLLVSLDEFKDSSWLPLNSFVHSGIHAVHWTKNKAPPQLIDQLFRLSNGLSVLAFQSLGILTGRQGVQSEIILVSTSYSSCLPKPRAAQ